MWDVKSVPQRWEHGKWRDPDSSNPMINGLGVGIPDGKYLLVDLGFSQHWAGFRLLLEAGQVFGSNWRATAQRLHSPPLGFHSPFRKKASGKSKPGLRKREPAPCALRLLWTKKCLSLSTLLNFLMEGNAF